MTTYKTFFPLENKTRHDSVQDKNNSDSSRFASWQGYLRKQRRSSKMQRTQAERDAAVRDRDVLRGTLAAELVSFPPSWFAQADDGGDRSAIGWWRDGRCLVRVADGSADWVKVLKLLSQTLPKVTLERLER